MSKTPQQIIDERFDITSHIQLIDEALDCRYTGNQLSISSNKHLIEGEVQKIKRHYESFGWHVSKGCGGYDTILYFSEKTDAQNE